MMTEVLVEPRSVVAPNRKTALTRRKRDVLGKQSSGGKPLAGYPPTPCGPSESDREGSSDLYSDMGPLEQVTLDVSTSSPLATLAMLAKQLAQGGAAPTMSTSMTTGK